MANRVFYVIAAALFFLAGVGSILIPNPISWGLCSLAIGLAISGVNFGRVTVA